jgi:hypothetical protein
VKFIHNAFRTELSRSQAEIKFLATLGEGDSAAILARFAVLHETLAMHELAENEVLFPAVNAIDAGRADVYFQAHRDVDGLRDGVLAALQAQNADKAFDGMMELVPLLSGHLDMEEQELLPWCDEQIPFPDQGRLAAEMGQKIPPEKLGPMVPWMVRLLSPDDREGVMRMWSEAMPPEIFVRIKGAVKGALKDAEWADLAGRFPDVDA